MSTTGDPSFQQLCDYGRETALLQSVAHLIEWDEQTLMPPDEGAYRAEQVAYLQGAIHRRWTDPRLGDLLAQLADSPLAADRHSDAGATIHHLRRERDKRVKLPQSLVEELARTASLGQQRWIEARKQNDFASFAPVLEKVFHLKRQEADALGYAEVPYDALLDHFEPDALTSNVAEVLGALRDLLVPLVAEIAAGGREPKREILARNFPVDVQRQFGRRAAEQIGFDFRAGRLDESAHPFCSGMGPRDCRITTRYDANFFPGAFFGILHEAGHGLYEQGQRTDWFGLPPGEDVSLGIHESQSRMWENLVGRSRAFWQYYYDDAQRAFPEALGGVPLDDFYFAVNDVRPSLIRVEADEATYNLHILIRFELEQDVLHGQLAAGDLPGAWNEKYRRYLGIEPPTDSDGVMQDVHWSAALVGYFPTYSLGNLYASQLFEQAEADLGSLADQFRRGEFTPLRDWLGEKIHRPGRCYSATELVHRVTGGPLTHEALLRHLRGKFAPLYGLG